MTVIAERERILEEVRAVLEREPRINLHKYPVQMDVKEGVLTLEGEVKHVAAKKLSMELAAVVSGVTGIIDRLHVAPYSRIYRHRAHQSQSHRYGRGRREDEARAMARQDQHAGASRAVVALPSLSKRGRAWPLSVSRP